VGHQEGVSILSPNKSAPERCFWGGAVPTLGVQVEACALQSVDPDRRGSLPHREGGG
jgi:hypothetical protein